MTFKELMQEIGYELKTTFWEDFTIADKLGEDAVRDTYKRAFEEWKGNYVYLTELVVILNHKIWQHYETNRAIAALYHELWQEADDYAVKNLTGKELDYFYKTTD